MQQFTFKDDQVAIIQKRLEGVLEPFIREPMTLTNMRFIRGAVELALSEFYVKRCRIHVDVDKADPRRLLLSFEQESNKAQVVSDYEGMRFMYLGKVAIVWAAIINGSGDMMVHLMDENHCGFTDDYWVPADDLSQYHGIQL